MMIQKPMEPLNKASFWRIHSHSGAPTVIQEVPLAQGTNEVQDVLDEEEEREPMSRHRMRQDLAPAPGDH